MEHATASTSRPAVSIDPETVRDWRVFPRDLREELTAAVGGDARAAKRIPYFVASLKEKQDHPWSRYLLFCLTWQSAAPNSVDFRLRAMTRFFLGGEVEAFTAPRPNSMEEIQPLYDQVFPLLVQLYAEFIRKVLNGDYTARS